MTKPTPRPPGHLSEPARRLYAAITGQYLLEAHHLAILTKALEAFDRAEEARVIVARDGLLTTSRLGELKPHPAVSVERDSRAAFLTAVKQLGLDLESLPSPSTIARSRARQ